MSDPINVGRFIAKIEERPQRDHLTPACPQPVVDDVFPLSEGAAALERMKNTQQFGKIVLDVDNS